MGIIYSKCHNGVIRVTWFADGYHSISLSYHTSGFLPPTMSYVTYDVVRHVRTTSYVWRTTSCWTSHVRCRTCDIQGLDVRHRTWDIVRDVQCRTSTYDIVCYLYDIVRVVVCTWHTTSYVHIVYDIVCTYDVACQHTTSYVWRTMSYVCWRW